MSSNIAAESEIVQATMQRNSDHRFKKDFKNNCKDQPIFKRNSPNVQPNRGDTRSRNLYKKLLPETCTDARDQNRAV